METNEIRERQIQEFIRYLDERVEKHKEDRYSAMNRYTRNDADLADRIDAARNEAEHIANAFCYKFGMKDKAKY